MAPNRTVAAGVDVGGTFTDIVVVDGDRHPRALKVPTTPDDQGAAVAAGLAQSPGKPAALVAHGTTTATNAVLERRVARTVLVTTDGFGGLLHIGRQNRPSLYDLAVVRPEPLVPRELVVTVRERTAPDGSALIPLTDEEIARAVDDVAALEPESVAVCLLFSFANPDHEQRLAAAVRDRLGVPVTRSSALIPEFREYERASTVTVNAAVAPVMGHYLSRLEQRLPDSTVTVMTSGGGSVGVAFAAEAPVHTLLSGPAAGVVAAGAVALSAGYPDAIAFDMGGTSTDVCLIRAGRPTVTTDAAIGGLPFRTPAVDIHTVGAGGGSIAWIDPGGALQVGPRSAGARPGPACYGLGGTAPTVTDAHCALGHLGDGRSLGGALTLDRDAADKALGTLPSDSEGAHGVLTVVRATMARALRRVSTERGVDPAGLALIAYGGAGPLHATALARDVGCPAVIVPPSPGVLSALGLLLAPTRHEVAVTVMASVDDDLDDVWVRLEEEAVTELRRHGVDRPTTVSRLADCRYPGQSHELRIAATGPISATFHAAHHQAYGYALTDEAVQVVTARVVAEGAPALAALPPAWDQGTPGPAEQREIGVGDERVVARVIHRASLAPGDVIDGPALVDQDDSTTLLLPGDHAQVDDQHNLVVTFDG